MFNKIVASVISSVVLFACNLKEDVPVAAEDVVVNSTPEDVAPAAAPVDNTVKTENVTVVVQPAPAGVVTPTTEGSGVNADPLAPPAVLPAPVATPAVSTVSTPAPVSTTK
jgi:ribonuclease E